MNKLVFFLCLICLFSCKSENVKFYESSILCNKNRLCKDGIVVIVPGAGYNLGSYTEIQVKDLSVLD